MTKPLSESQKAARAARRQAATQLLDKSPQDPPKPSRTNSVVFVACKVGGGILIRDHAKGTRQEQIVGGGTREVATFRGVGPNIKINGPVTSAVLAQKPAEIGGYVITEGVPAAVFERWMAVNVDSAMVRNKLIFGHEKRDAVEGWAREHASVRTNMEPLNVAMTSKNGKLTFSDIRIKRESRKVSDGSIAPEQVDALTAA